MRWRAAAVLALAGGVAFLWTSGCSSPAHPPRVIRTVAELRTLNPALLQTGVAVRLRGVLTIADPDWHILAVQDDTGGIVLRHPAQPLGLWPGDVVEVTGSTGSDCGIPSVVKATVRPAGRAALPEPVDVSPASLLSGRWEGRRVQVVLTATESTALDSAHLVHLKTNEAKGLAAIGGVYRLSRTVALRGRRLRIRGVPTTLCNPAGGRDQTRLYFRDERDVDVVDQGGPLPPEITAPGGASATAPPLNSIRAVKSLSREQANKALPASFEGVVTLTSRRHRGVFVQDGSLGIYVRVELSHEVPVQPGQRVRVDAFTVRGGYAPSVFRPRFQILGNPGRPEPVRLAPGTALQGWEENLWVELEGVAAGVEVVRDGMELILFQGSRRVRLEFVRGDTPERLRSFLNSRIALRGIYSPRFSASGVLQEYHLVAESPDSVRILEPAPAEAERRSLASLARFDLRGSPQHRIQVSGTVTYNDRRGRVYLQDGEYALRLANPGDAGPALHTLAVAEGALAPDQRRPHLETVRWIGSAPGRPLAAAPVLAESVGSGELDGHLVAVEGFVESRRTVGGDLQLRMVAGDVRFAALLDAPDTSGALPQVRPGALLRLTGICETQPGWAGEEPRLAAVLLRTSEDVMVLQAAPWWDLQRALIAASTASATLVMALLWVIFLRRKLVRQMALRSQLEEQLLHAQKLESVGRLAGGVAHDFNNYLTVIIGYADLLLEPLETGDPARPALTAIRDVGDKAALLTKQLLAFSRKQVLQPVRCNLNDVLAEAHKTLLPLIGEHIELITQPATPLSPVSIDPAQFTQVIVNLAVNARDAMPDGGKLILETSEVELAEDYVRRHPDVKAGRYVQFAVTDTGCGMDEETRRRIFEPFFTTKERGRGTGLGLAVVFGIVKQSGGHIHVYSEPDRGTSFKVYLPAAVVESGPAATAAAPQRLQGSETVLVVEDQPEVRAMVCTGLAGYGYRVLEATAPEAALRLLEQENGHIHLLLTDVVMPGMNGRALASKVMALRPGIRVLYMSGYSENVVVHQGVLDPGLAYIQKPFGPAALAAAVRRVLDQQAG